jgi:hypothetical protein
MAKNSSEISTSESNVKEIYYSTPSVDFNPSAPSFSPKRVQSPQNMEKEPEVTSQPPASTRLNPDSKPFVPSVPRPTSGLNVEAAPFVPSFAVPQQVELLPDDVSGSLSEMRINSKEDLLHFLHCALQTLSSDPSQYEELLDRLCKELNSENVKDVAVNLVEYGVSSANAYYDVARVVDTLCTKKSQLLRHQFLMNLRAKVVESEGLKPDEVVSLSWFVAEITMRILMDNKQHFAPLILTLLDLLKKMLESNVDSTVQASCCILKLTGAVLEGSIGEEHEKRRDDRLDVIFSRLNDLVRDETISKQTVNLILRVINLRAAKWEQATSNKEKGAVSQPSMSTDEDGTVYFHNAKSPPVGGKPGKGIDWREYIDDTGNPYAEHSDVRYEEQFDIESEFEQFLAEEHYHYTVGEDYEGEHIEMEKQERH